MDTQICLCNVSKNLAKKKAMDTLTSCHAQEGRP